MTAGMALRTFAQAAVFLIIARALEVGTYGAFAAVLALTSALASFASLGSGTLMVRDVSRNPAAFAESWGRALAITVFCAPFLFSLYVLIARLVLPPAVPLSAVCMLGLADLLLVPLCDLGFRAFQAHGRIKTAAWLMFFPILSRLAAASVLFVFVSTARYDLDRLIAWSGLYMAAATVSAAYALRLVRRELGRASPPIISTLLTVVREGIAFSFGSAALRLYTDIDKAMLARLSTLEMTGAYSAGYRVVDMLMLPLTALLQTLLPGMFRTAARGTQATLTHVKKIVLLPFIYTVFGSIALYLCADFLPLMLGRDYEEAASALRWLAWLPILTFSRQFVETALVVLGHQGPAVKVLLAGAAVNIVLNLWLIPTAGWRGAAIATYSAEGLMTVAMVALVRYISPRLTLRHHETR